MKTADIFRTTPFGVVIFDIHGFKQGEVVTIQVNENSDLFTAESLSGNRADLTTEQFLPGVGVYELSEDWFSLSEGTLGLEVLGDESIVNSHVWLRDVEGNRELVPFSSLTFIS